ncbi:hypothetical protein DFJ73DRAFT_960968 [Zopfochytrium polystomum]|nr:hypothetical protein DFJ73DRAFT_960968 [Zopfochytrium polystomum]
MNQRPNQRGRKSWEGTRSNFYGHGDSSRGDYYAPARLVLVPGEGGGGGGGGGGGRRRRRRTSAPIAAAGGARGDKAVPRNLPERAPPRLLGGAMFGLGAPAGGSNSNSISSSNGNSSSIGGSNTASSSSAAPSSIASSSGFATAGSAALHALSARRQLSSLQPLIPIPPPQPPLALSPFDLTPTRGYLGNGSEDGALGQGLRTLSALSGMGGVQAQIGSSAATAAFREVILARLARSREGLALDGDTTHTTNVADAQPGRLFSLLPSAGLAFGGDSAFLANTLAAYVPPPLLQPPPPPPTPPAPPSFAHLSSLLPSTPLPLPEHHHQLSFEDLLQMVPFSQSLTAAASDVHPAVPTQHVSSFGHESTPITSAFHLGPRPPPRPPPTSARPSISPRVLFDGPLLPNNSGNAQFPGDAPAQAPFSRSDPMISDANSDSSDDGSGRRSRSRSCSSDASYSSQQGRSSSGGSRQIGSKTRSVTGSPLAYQTSKSCVSGSQLCRKRRRRELEIEGDPCSPNDDDDDAISGKRKKRKTQSPAPSYQQLHFDADDDDENDLEDDSARSPELPRRSLMFETATYFASLPSACGDDDSDETETDPEIAILRQNHPRYYYVGHHSHNAAHHRDRSRRAPRGPVQDINIPSISIAPYNASLASNTAPSLNIRGPPSPGSGGPVPKRGGVLSAAASTDSSSVVYPPTNAAARNQQLPTPSATSSSVSGNSARTHHNNQVAGAVCQTGNTGDAASSTTDSLSALIDQDPALRAVVDFERQVPSGLIEIVYVTDESGNILSLNERIWNEWLLQNAELPLPERILRCLAPQIVGRNLFEFISDPKVQTFSRHILYMLTSGQQKRYQYYWYCDSPELERKMHMTVSRVDSNASGATLVLWVSKIIAETILSTPQAYLASPPASLNEDPNLTNRTRRSCLPQPNPFRRRMSGCKPFIGLRGKLGLHINGPRGTGLDDDELFPNHLWLTPNQYYVDAGLGTSPITIQHGICEVCYDEIGNMFFPPGTFSEGIPIARSSTKSGGSGGLSSAKKSLPLASRVATSFFGAALPVSPSPAVDGASLRRVASVSSNRGRRLFTRRLPQSTSTVGRGFFSSGNGTTSGANPRPPPRHAPRPGSRTAEAPRSIPSWSRVPIKSATAVRKRLDAKRHNRKKRPSGAAAETVALAAAAAAPTPPQDVADQQSAVNLGFGDEFSLIEQPQPPTTNHSSASSSIIGSSNSHGVETELSRCSASFAPRAEASSIFGPPPPPPAGSSGVVGGFGASDATSEQTEEDMRALSMFAIDSSHCSTPTPITLPFMPPSFRHRIFCVGQLPNPARDARIRLYFIAWLTVDLDLPPPLLLHDDDDDDVVVVAGSSQLAAAASE